MTRRSELQTKYKPTQLLWGTLDLPTVALVLIEAILLVLLLFSPKLALLSTLLIVFILALSFLPEWPFSLFLTGNVLLMVLFDSVRPQIPAPTAIAFAVLVLGCVSATLLGGPLPTGVKFGPTFRSSLILALVLTLALTYSPRPGAGLRKLAFYLLYNVSLVGLPPLVLKSLKQFERIFLLAFAFGIVLAVYTLPIAYHTPHYIRLSPSSSVNAIWLARSLGFSGIAALFVFSRWRDPFIRIGIGVSFVLFLYLIARTASRAPLLGLLAIVLTWITLHPSFTKRKRIVLSALAAIGAIFFVVHSAGQVTHRLTVPVAQETSTAFRLLGWYHALQLFLMSPFFGVGTGGFFLPLPFLPLRYAHNLFLELASETGILGLTVGIAFVAVGIGYAVRLYRRAKALGDLRFSLVALSNLSVLIYALWNALFSGDIPSNEIVWLGAGFVWAQWRVLDKNGKHPR